MSITFVSADEGFALGNAPCSSPPCTSLVRTTDGAHTWAGVPAPRAPITPRGSAFDAAADAVSTVRFGSPSDGWVFGPALWATHDGARTWKAVSLPGRVVGVAVSAGTAFAVVTNCNPGTDCTQPSALYRSPAATDAWTVVANVTGPGRPSLEEPIALHGAVGYVTMPGATSRATNLFATTDGRSWHAVPDPCSTQEQNGGLTAMAAPDDTTLFELCELGVTAGQGRFRLYRSDHQGASPAPVGEPFQGASAAVLAAATPSLLASGQWSGGTLLLRSSDSGRSFTPASASIPSGGVPLFDLGFTTPTQGVVVAGGGVELTTSQLQMTRDGGATWSKITVR